MNLGREPNRFAIEVFDGMTGKQVGQVENIAVNPQGSFQLKSLLTDYAPGVNQGYARVVPSKAEHPSLLTQSSSTLPVRANAPGTPALSIAHREQVRFGEMKLRGHCALRRTVAFPWCTQKRSASSQRLKWLPGWLQMDIAELRW